MSLDDTRFHQVADEILARILDGAEEALGDIADVDLENGILKIDGDDGSCFVINKHAPNRQIWVSSPYSGASHFDYDEDNDLWKATRGGADLLDLLGQDFSKLCGESVTL